MRGRYTIGLAVLASLAFAAPALGADTYVDQSLGSDSNLCVNPTLPCSTILGGLAKAGNTNTVHVAPGVYAEQIDLNGDKALVATGTPSSTILTSSTAPTIHVTGAGGSVAGFTIRTSQSASSSVPLQVDAPAAVTGNVFDTDSSTLGSTFVTDVVLGSASDDSVVSQNSFLDNGGGSHTAIDSAATGSQTQISSNRIAGDAPAIYVEKGSPTVSGNVITDWHNGPGILVESPTAPSGTVTPAITANYLHGPGTAATQGIYLHQTTGGGSVGGALSRNRVFGGSAAAAVDHATQAVTFNSDLLTGATTGLSATATTVNLTNVTAFGNTGQDINLQDSTLTMDSSVVGNTMGHNGATTCTITNSAGNNTGGTGCTHYQFFVDAAADFVNAAGGDFHLKSSPNVLIDNGNSSPPAAGSLDFDSELRVNPECLSGGSPRRDIGADEFYDACGSSGVSISSPTAGAASDASVSFSFSAGFGGGNSFRCSLDGSAYVTCSSPFSYEGLANGAHTFSVRNIGSGGNRVDVTRAITVDGSPPESDITAGPATGSTTSPSASFTFSSEPNATFQCSLDGAAFVACSSPFTASGLSDGSHTLLVRAVDAVGNVDPTPVSRTWTVDATPPETSIDSGPADGSSTTATSATYSFTSEAGATFECSVDGGAFAACTSPKALTALAAGSHTFAVRATDSLGNVDATPATRKLIVTKKASDTKAPTTTLKKVKVKGDQATVKFTADEAATFTCKLDKGKSKPCKSPKTYKHLDAGKHKVLVQATDAAGNVEKKPVKAKFKV